jgi:hypothetical protein
MPPITKAWQNRTNVSAEQTGDNKWVVRYDQTRPNGQGAIGNQHQAFGPWQNAEDVIAACREERPVPVVTQAQVDARSRAKAEQMYDNQDDLDVNTRLQLMFMEENLATANPGMSAAARRESIIAKMQQAIRGQYGQPTG